MQIETMEMLHLSSLRQNEGHARRIWLLKKEIRLFGVAGILIGYFTLAWTPYIVFEFISIVKGQDLDRYIRYLKFLTSLAGISFAPLSK